MKKGIVTAALAGMMLTTTSVLAQSVPPSASDQEVEHLQQMQTYLQQMQTYLNKIQAQMNQIHQTQDPEERHRLMQEHIKSMQEGMQMIHKMSGEVLEPHMTIIDMLIEQRLEQQKAGIEASPGFNEKSPSPPGSQ